MQSRKPRREHSQIAHADHQAARSNYPMVSHSADAQMQEHHVPQHILHCGPSFPMLEHALTRNRVELTDQTTFNIMHSY